MDKLEIWKSIQGYEDQYEVSNTGKVRSLKTNHNKSLIKQLAQYIEKHGYISVKLFKKI